MKFDDAKLKDILVAGNYVKKEDVDEAEKYIKERGGTFLNFFLMQDLVTKDLLGQAVAEFYKIQYSDLNSNQPAREQILKIPEEIGKSLRIVLFAETDKGLVVTTDSPDNPEMDKGLKQIFPKQKIILTYSLGEDIDRAFIHYQKPLETRFSKIIEGQKRVAPEILEEVFEDAHTHRTSDIHFEPQADIVLVRFRVDGVLREAGRLPKLYYENILNRIKVKSGLRIDEHFGAQDGSMNFTKDKISFDMRVSIVPTVDGEKMVMRILSSYEQGLTLNDLGLNGLHQKLLEDAAKKPFGMILVTGPTGSGKTTTLYSVLKLLHRPEVNITTIEEPVEYKIKGINQIQVNQLTNLTFAKGLRSIVRQDPNIILVGEIRDQETAEIAVNAALTGHLLLSTFHANDASTAIPRLVDMGIETFLLASTLELIIAQRLVRKICERCRYSVSVTKAEVEEKYPKAARYFTDKKITLYAGKGCDNCGHSGYKGRTGIFEFIPVTPEMEELILKNPATREIWTLAKSQGAKSLFEDGLARVKNGITTLDELLRIAPPSDI